MSESAVSVMVVSFNTIEKTRRCLSCIEPEHEVIVVDNASSDGSAEMVRAEFPQVRLIANKHNVGFGPANNQGSRLASRPLVLYLNSDAYAFPGAIDLVAAAFDDAAVVAAGGQLLNMDGSLQDSVAGNLTLGKVFTEQFLLDSLLQPSGHGYWRTRFLLGNNPDASAIAVDQVMGACLMVRRGLEEFDERYFLYCEDTDLCLRLRRHGRIVYLPKAQFTHELGSSSADRRWLGVARYNWGKELYFRIHHGRFAEAICFLLDRSGALLRLIAWTAVSVVKPSKRSQVGLFWKVFTASVKP